MHYFEGIHSLDWWWSIKVVCSIGAACGFVVGMIWALGSVAFKINRDIPDESTVNPPAP